MAILIIFFIWFVGFVYYYHNGIQNQEMELDSLTANSVSKLIVLSIFWFLEFFFYILLNNKAIAVSFNKAYQSMVSSSFED